MRCYRTFTKMLAMMTALLGPAAWAQTPVFSVRLGGYTPNTYGQCRPISGFGDGTGGPCTGNSECTVGAEFCGQMFRDISCPGLGAAGDDHCLAATGGPSKCVETSVLVGTVLRCSAVSDAPEGMVQPGDTVFLEVWADEWDQTPDGPDSGRCENGINDCAVGEPGQCKSCRDLNDPPGDACIDNADCTGGLDCRQDAHCELNGNDIERPCDAVGGAQCGVGRDCVADECKAWPTIAVYQWQIDASTYSNHGPTSSLIPGSIPCTAATQDDDCKHGYMSGCELCSVAICKSDDTCSPEADAFVYKSRLDFIFNNLQPVVACRTGTAFYTCGGFVFPTSAVADTGSPRYLGTAALTVSANACGTFTVDLVDNRLTTFVNDAFGVRVPNAVTTNPATITISPPPPSCDPRCPSNGLCPADVCNCDGFCLSQADVDCDEGEECNPSTGRCEGCGNGNIESLEECDDEGESATCDDDCTIAECGDDTLNETAGEECDGADSAACDGRRCRLDCTCAPPSCGDGIRDPGEMCDGGDNERCQGRPCRTDCVCSMPRPATPVPVED